MGTIASILANAYRGKGQPLLKAQDFNPFKTTPPKFKAKASDELLKKVEIINAMFGGKDLRRG